MPGKGANRKPPKYCSFYSQQCQHVRAQKIHWSHQLNGLQIKDGWIGFFLKGDIPSATWLACMTCNLGVWGLKPVWVLWALPHCWQDPVRVGPLVPIVAACADSCGGCRSCHYASNHPAPGLLGQGDVPLTECLVCVSCKVGTLSSKPTRGLLHCAPLALQLCCCNEVCSENDSELCVKFITPTVENDVSWPEWNERLAQNILKRWPK